MKLKSRNLLVKAFLVGGMTISGFAIAEWIGQYYCGSSCSFNEPLLEGDGFIFIRTDVNPDVASWVDSQGNPNTVTLCNGSECALYRYVKLSGQFQLVSKFPSNWVGSTIQSDGGGGLCGGGMPGGSLQWGVTGYKPVYRTATVTTPTGTSSQRVVAGYEPTYGMLLENAVINAC